jgi:hypothetical protein
MSVAEPSLLEAAIPGMWARMQTLVEAAKPALETVEQALDRAFRNASSRLLPTTRDYGPNRRRVKILVRARRSRVMRAGGIQPPTNWFEVRVGREREFGKV